MNAKNTEYLCSTYPVLFGYNFYFECEDGWFNLIDDLSKEVEEVLQELDTIPTPFIIQVKEKFGGLRYYTSTHDDKINDIIIKYEGLSYTTCEYCSSPDAKKVNISKYWIKTACQSCFVKYRKE